ncbi:MAG: glycoside hydrolase family 5 protein [Solirubrobacteraceae bacterium]
MLVLGWLAVASPSRGADLRILASRLIDGAGRGRAVQLRGVNRSGLEYACIQGWGFFDSPHPWRIDDRGMIAAMRSWQVDAVRVPLNEDCWLGLNAPRATSGPRYRRVVEAYVRALRAAHLYVILDLHWAAPGRVRAVAQLPLPDRDHAPAFWRSVAAAFKRDHAVIFDLFNEPYGVGWDCWLRGCRIPAGGGAPAYRAAGMQQLVDAVRSTGATQPLLLGGIQYALDLSGWFAHMPRDPDHQLIASEHDYGGLSPCQAGCRSAILATAARVPVLLGELGETDCAHGYIDAMMKFADAHRVGYLGWAWDAVSPGGWSCGGGPSLILDYRGTPTAFGAGFRDHLRRLGSPVGP